MKKKKTLTEARKSEKGMKKFIDERKQLKGEGFNEFLDGILEGGNKDAKRRKTKK